MKLCWLIPDDRSGGVASVALSCCRQAAQAGHQVTLLIMLNPIGHITEEKKLRIESLHIEGVGKNTPQILVNWLSENPQDVIFLNGCEQADIAIPFMPRNTKCVYVVHDTARRYWITALRNENQIDAIVAVSDTVARNFKGHLQNKNKLTVIHNGTNFPDINEIEKGDSRENSLVFAGGDKPVKGVYDLLTLWPELIKLKFDGNLHWFGEIGTTIRKEVNKLPNQAQIKLHGKVARSQIYQQSATSKVFLMLSRVEPFGMATIECMGMGCIPIAWDIPTGTKEIVNDTANGFFVPLGDTKEMAMCVLKACEMHSEMHLTIMHNTRDKFSEQAMWRGYDTLLKELICSPIAVRPLAGKEPPSYRPPVRIFQLIPAFLRNYIRMVIGRSPRLGYLLRDFRGI